MILQLQIDDEIFKSLGDDFEITISIDDDEIIAYSTDDKTFGGIDWDVNLIKEVTCENRNIQ